jgi:hypothetical protein
MAVYGIRDMLHQWVPPIQPDAGLCMQQFAVVGKLERASRTMLPAQVELRNTWPFQLRCGEARLERFTGNRESTVQSTEYSTSYDGYVHMTICSIQHNWDVPTFIIATTRWTSRTRRSPHSSAR